MSDQPSVPGLRIDPATPEDIPLMLDLIRELAEYEHEPEAARATPDQLHEALFGARRAAEAVIARLVDPPSAQDAEVAPANAANAPGGTVTQDKGIGWALWFQTFSTWTGKPGLWLEDLYVRPQYRRLGVGRALMAYLAQICFERGYGRFEWSVLDWNAPAVDFYKALGAAPEDEWTTYRLTGEALRRLANGA